MSLPDSPTLKILVIRRDNIGDLVCTMPLIGALRRRFPRAHIAALVNTYNCQVLEGHPDLNAVYAYAKAKHRPPGQSRASVYWDKLVLMRKLRAQHFDCVLLASSQPGASALRLARWIAPAHIAGYADPAGLVDLALPHDAAGATHEVEDVFRLAQLFGIEGATGQAQHGGERGCARARKRGPRRTQAGTQTDRAAHQRAQAQPALAGRAFCGTDARPERRGRISCFCGRLARPTIRSIRATTPRRRPSCGGRQMPLVAYPTHELRDLAAALSLADYVICSDGGAMHIAAALGKPILCFFGDSDATRWHPWGVPYRLLQPDSRDAADISLAAALQAFRELQQQS